MPSILWESNAIATWRDLSGGMGVDRFIGGNLLDYAYSRGAYPCAMRSQKFGEFNKGTKRNPRLANRHTHTSDRVEHPGRYDNDMTRRGFNPRHRTVSGSINAFASHPPPEERVRVGDHGFGVTGDLERSRTVSCHSDRHGEGMVVVAAMRDLGAQLVEILPLRRLQGLRDPVQCLVLRRIGAKFGSAVFPVGIEALPSRAIALRPEAAEPDTGILPREATDKASGPGLQADAEDFRDALEILGDGVIPVMARALSLAQDYVMRLRTSPLLSREFGCSVDKLWTRHAQAAG
eukprot:gene21059-41016_t